MYNSVSLLSGLGKRTITIAILGYLWVFIGLVSPVCGLSQDTLATQDTLQDTLGDTRDTLTQDALIRSYLAEKVTQQSLPQIRQAKSDLDSLHVRYHRLDSLHIDTVGIDSMLDRLYVMDQEISLWKLETAQARKEIQRLHMDNDLENVRVPQQLLIHMQQDSLAVADSLLAVLSLDHGRLSSNLRQFKGQQDLAQLDTTLHATDSIAQRSIVNRIRHNVASDQSLRNYFDLDSWGGRVLLLLLSSGYFWFLYRLGNKTRTTDDQDVLLYKNEPVWIPVLKTIVFFGVLLPLFSWRVPVFVIQVVYLCLFVVLYVLLYQQYSQEKKWIIFVWIIVYVLLIASNLVLSEELRFRVLSAIVNSAALILTWLLFTRKKTGTTLHYMPRYALMLLLGGFVMALITNLAGYITLSRIFSVASAVGFIQGLVLTAFNKMIMHDVRRYYEEAGEERNIRRFDLGQLTRSLTRLLATVNILIVLSALLNTLGIADAIFNGLEKIFLKQRSIGGVVYTYANVLLAVAAIVGANWLQKNLNRIFNPSTDDSTEVRKYALFPLFRLLIVVVGFLIAIAILGVGVTQLTVVVGALSVGIGLGLQNIINNFVSGIILIFEKPFKIGDYIELADKKGRVSQIGIRSSVLLSDQGGKVIIPNGDLLSGRIVNWTLYDAQIRFNMELVVGNTLSIKEIKEKLYEMLKNNRYVEQAAPMHIYTVSIQSDTHTVAVQIVLKHVRYADEFRSMFLEKVKNEMDTKDVKISSS